MVPEAGRSRALLLRRVGGVVLLLCAACCAEREPQGPPSIVLVSIDTLRADHLPSYGYERPTAPALAAFAAESVRFDEALSQAGATLPSHLSLITSLYPPQFRITARDGVHTNQIRTRLRLPDAVVTLTEVLRDAGYSTAAFTDGAFMSPYYGFGQGFEHFEANLYTEAVREHGLRFTLPKLERFLAARDAQGAASPLFLVVHTYDVHEPYDAPKPWARAFTRLSFGELGRSLGYRAVPSKLNQHLGELSPEDVAEVRGLYDNGIRAADTSFARLLDLLARHGLYDEALVVVLSDHGEEFLEHGAFNHGPTVHHEIVHVPLLLRLPGARRGGEVVTGPVALVDVAPTLLELAGLPVPSHFEGHSLAGLIEGRDAGAWLDERPIYFESDDLLDGARGMRRGAWVVMETSAGTQLYDLSSDPGERVDLAQEQPERAARMARALDAGARALEEAGRERGWHAQPGPAAPPRPEHERQLRALGYVE